VARLSAVACIPVAVILCVAWALHNSRPGIVGSNGIRAAIFAGAIPPHGKACQGIGSASATVDGVQLVVGAEGKGPQPVRLEFAGDRVGPVLRSYADGVVTLRLPPGMDRPSGGVCVHNFGRLPLHVAGENAAAGRGAVVNGRPSSFYISFTLIAAAPPTWWSEASSIVSRVGLARAGAGSPATGALVIALLVLSLAGAVAATWRWTS
jgi:hypothetical protein